jgi:signal transduction histidine kinase
MIFILPGFWAIYGSSQGLLPALGALASALIFWASLVKIASKRRASFGWLIAIGFLVSVATAGLFFEVNVLLGQSADFEFTAYQGLNLAVVSIGNVLFSAFQSLRWIQLGLVADDNTSAELLVARLRQDLWLTRQRLAKLIHGVAQSRLQAATLLLRKQDTTQADRNAAATSLQVLVDELFEPGDQNVQFKQNLKNLQALWAGVCEVHVELNSSMLAQLESDSSAAGCLDEFLREAVTNAVKHSGADEVEILVENVPGPALSVRIRHALPEGLTELPKTQTGFGSKLYEAVTASWSLKDDGTDVILDGIIPWTPETEV